MARLQQKVDLRYGELKEMERANGRSVVLSNSTYRKCAEEASEGQFEFFKGLLANEYAVRRSNKVARMRRLANFPCVKDFEGFDWDGIEFPAGFDREDMLSCDWVDRRENLVLYGGVGNGKSHTSVALGLIACGQGRRVAFKSTSQLVLDLNASLAAGTLDETMRDLARNEMIILDEWGYLPTDPDGAKLLFRVVSMCYERISLVLTTNIEFSRWGSIFNDEDMAKAMLDRVIHHGRLVTYDRESYRVKHALMRGEGASRCRS